MIDSLLRMRLNRPGFNCLLVLALWSLAHAAVADETTCGALTNAYGPFDYRTAGASELRLVEDYHFTPEVEALRAGKSGTLGSDLDYTLRAFPNHYRALVAMMNLQFKARTDRPQGAQWRVPCYFDRALRFRADDGTVRTIYGVYLLRVGKPADAIHEFDAAAELGDDSGNLHYNAGLAYFEVRDYDKALEQAQKAYAAGFALPGLRDKLKKAGKWPTGG